jgi:hypothetical protein
MPQNFRSRPTSDCSTGLRHLRHRSVSSVGIHFSVMSVRLERGTVYDISWLGLQGFARGCYAPGLDKAAYCLYS